MAVRGPHITVYDKVTGEVLGEVPEDFRRDLRAKIHAAALAFPRAKGLSFEERVALSQSLARELEAARPEMEELLVREAGNPRKFARWEAARAAQIARDFPEVLEEVRPRELPARAGRNLLLFEPYGVVGLITPANAPLVVPTYNLLSSLLTGNATVLKPSSRTPLIAHRVVELAYRAGAPEGSIQISTCPAEEAAWEFVENPEVRALVTYAGSAVGKDNLVKLGTYLARAKRDVKGCLQVEGRLLHYVPELAGNDPFIVLEGADLEKAVEAAVVGAFTNAGQLCFSAKRILVEKPVAEEFRAGLVKKVSELKVGSPDDPETDVVRLTHRDTLELSVYQFEEALRKGGKLLVGGLADEETFLPTVVEFEPDLLQGPREARPLLWEEEAFAPIRSLVVFEGDDEAVKLANDSRYGLAASIFGPEARALSLATRLEAGRVAVNESPLFADPHLPLGGVKDSGLRGAEHKVRELTYVKRIHIGAATAREA